MTTPNDQTITQPLPDESPFINYERIWYRILRYWYIVIASLLIALSIAFAYNRYTPKIYPITTSILIKESEEAGQTAELLYNNPLIDAYRNFLNEPYIIRSFPLIQQVVDSLGFTVQIMSIGDIKTSEQYDIPLKITGNKKGENYLKGEYQFIIENNSKFQLIKDVAVSDSNKEGKVVLNGNFNDTLRIGDYALYFAAGNVASFKSHTLKLTFMDGLDVARVYASKLRVEWAEEGASVVNLSINSKIPQKEIDFLNTLVHIYSQQDQNKKQEVAHNSKVFIDQQLATISDSLLIIEKQLETFKDNNATTNLDLKAQQLLLQLGELEKTKTAFIVKNSYYEYLEKYLMDSDLLDQIVLPSSVGITDPILSSLIGQMIELQIQAKAIGNTPSSENPLSVNMRNRIVDLRTWIIESINTLRETDQIAVNQINEQLKSFEASLARLPKAERQLVTIQRAYKLGEGLYVFLTQKRSEAAISEASTVSDVITVNKPYRAGGVISPKTKVNYIIALFFGLGLPIGFFILKEFLNSKVQSKEDIFRTTSIPIIGVIGHNEDPDKMVVSNKPKSSLAEAFRSLRSNLNYFIQQEKFVMMVTSSISGEGKSFTALNLANIFALSGKKTIILGADMRKPRIYQELNLNNTIGLSTYLSGKAEIDEIILDSAIDNLHIISGGPVPPNPGELLLHAEFEDLLGFLKKQYEIVLIDTPPVGIVADALEVANFVDHTLFITRQNYTPLDAVKNIDEQVKQGKVKNISIVFNDIYKFGPGYGYGYGHGYGYGYGYGYGGKSGYYDDDKKSSKWWQRS